MPSQQTALQIENRALVEEAWSGLAGSPKTLSPWMFYDEAGSALFEDITRLPEYYLTRTEREILRVHAEGIVAAMGAALTVMELGAGSAAKTGLLLAAAVRRHGRVVYQPLDVSSSALAEAETSLAASLPGVEVHPQVVNYVTETYAVEREDGERVLALYIGSSIGNFSPAEQRDVLRNLRAHLQAGDALLLGTDLAPGSAKPVGSLLAAYDDAAGVTAAFNRNMLVRLNREADADFVCDRFAHEARWNAEESRIEMHLRSVEAQRVHVGGETFEFAAGETIHTESSYKFTAQSLASLFEDSGFRVQRNWQDPGRCFAVTLAVAEQDAPTSGVPAASDSL